MSQQRPSVAMTPSTNSDASLNARKAVTALRNLILNPSTSIAIAILPKKMADRLQLATIAFSLERFIEARKQDRPELALMAAALPGAYIQAEIYSDDFMDSTPTSMGSEDFTKVGLPRSKIDLTRGVAELPPATTSNVQGFSSTTTDCILPEESWVFGVVTTIWGSITSFRCRL